MSESAVLTRYEAVFETGVGTERVDTDCSRQDAVEVVSHRLYQERNKGSELLVLVRRDDYWEAVRREGSGRERLRGFVHEVPVND